MDAPTPRQTTDDADRSADDVGMLEAAGRELWGDQFTRPDVDPDADGHPEMDAVAAKTDRLLALAEEHLDGPVSTETEMWEDGEFEIRVMHSHGPFPDGPECRSVHALRYHSRDGDVLRLVSRVDPDDGTETLVDYATVTNIGAVG